MVGSRLNDITAWLDMTLRTTEFADYSGAMNGLQVENSGLIQRVAVAVDCCESTMRMAVDAQSQLLVVHHGLFWRPITPLTGPNYRKIKLAIDHNLAVYSSHLPLDAHEELGNNVLLADALGLGKGEACFEAKGQNVGRIIDCDIDRKELIERLERVVRGSVIVAPGGPAKVRKVAVISGGAGGELAEVAAHGVDTFITGEGAHWCYSVAEELGVNLLLAGHYATETFGVKALGAAVSKEFGVSWQFLDHPSGL